LITVGTYTGAHPWIIIREMHSAKIGYAFFIRGR
jgi:hypothetical protein